MEDRHYDELPWTVDGSLSQVQLHAVEARRAVELSYRAKIESMAGSLCDQKSVLVVADKLTSAYLEDVLTQNERLRGARWNPVASNPNPGTGAQAGNRVANRGSVIGALVQSLSETIADAAADDPSPIVVMRHLDLMTWTAHNAPRHELNDVVYWLTEFHSVSKLAFWDPIFPLPRVLQDLFPNVVSLEQFSREILWQLVSPQEARRLCSDPEKFTLASQLTLYQYVSGTNVIDLRRILREMSAEHFPVASEADSENPLRFLRSKIAPGAVTPSLGRGEIAGYESVQQALKREVSLPFKWRHMAQNEVELQQADALIPSGVIFYGPPGTGKSEWAKSVASELGATLSVIHGPELKHSLVGETERAIRSIFAQARRTAPAVILIDEMDSLTPARRESDSNFEASMVAQFLAEMDGLRNDEAVLVVGTTNRIDSVDPAFLRPGRFGVTIHVDYPGKDDRKRILDHYNKRWRVGLTKQSIETLTLLTNGPLDQDEENARQQEYNAYVRHKVSKDMFKDSGPLFEQRLKQQFGLMDVRRFSGDHLRAIVLWLLREKKLAVEEGQNDFNVNVTPVLEKAVSAARRRTELFDTGPQDSGTATGGSWL